MQIKYDKKPVIIKIEKNSERSFHNYNLEKNVKLEVNLDISNATSSDKSSELMNWYQFDLPRELYKSGKKTVSLIDRSNQEDLELAADICETDKTDCKLASIVSISL